MSDFYKSGGTGLPQDRTASIGVGYSKQRSRDSLPVHSMPGPSVISSPSVEPAADKRNREHIHRFAGVAVGLASVVSEHILSHPCVVLRRQCQVHNMSRWYHLTPFTLFHTVFNIQRHQSMTTLWKGIGSALMVKGIVVASESAINEFTPLPKEVNRHSPLKKMVEHIILKSLSLVIVTPFYASSLVETVQSEIACERPGVFDCLVEGMGRLVSFTSAQPTRLLPIWKLLVPTVVYGLCHYIIASLASYRVSVTMRADIQSNHVEESVEKTLYELYYPELVATFTGNLLADTLLYPLETILHRLYLQGTRTIIDNTDTGLEVVPIITRYDGAVDCYMTLVTEEGFSALYKGFGALILQYALHIAILKLTRCLFELLSGEKVGGRPVQIRSAGMRVEVGRNEVRHRDDVRYQREPEQQLRYVPMPSPRDSTRESYTAATTRDSFTTPGRPFQSVQ